MRAFAQLLDALSTHHGRNDKLALMLEYFRATPDPDRGWALAALTDGVPVKVPFRRVLADLMAERLDPVLYKLSRDFVGDTAETVSLLWPGDSAGTEPPSLSEIVARLEIGSARAMDTTVAAILDAGDATERWAFLKFIGGALRVGVSSRLAKTALAELGSRDVSEIEEVWHALKAPYLPLFAWLEGRGDRPEATGVPSFRPLMLATPIEQSDWPNLAAADFVAEWKWDGIRVQIAATENGVRIFSRTGEDISGTFPEIATAFIGLDVTVDGELLVQRDGVVRPFNDLQQRLNRKVVSPRLMAEHPAHVRLYDLLILDGEDLRALPFADRRLRLEAWHAGSGPAATDVSELIAFDSFDGLATLHETARAAGIEGLMLKRRASPYFAGRPNPALLAPWITGGGKVEPVETDKDVFGDGSVVILNTPGHTPGHHSLLVRLSKFGPVILSGDAVHFRENAEGASVPFFNFDRSQTLASVGRIKALVANIGAKLVIQHDARDVAVLPAFPAVAD